MKKIRPTNNTVTVPIGLGKATTIVPIVAAEDFDIVANTKITRSDKMTIFGQLIGAIFKVFRKKQ